MDSPTPIQPKSSFLLKSSLPPSHSPMIALAPLHGNSITSLFQTPATDSHQISEPSYKSPPSFPDTIKSPPSPQSRYVRLFRYLEKCIEDSLLAINQSRLSEIYDNVVRGEFEDLHDLVFELQRGLRTNLQKKSLEILIQFQMQKKLDRLDGRIHEARRKNSKFPHTFEGIYPNPTTTDIAVDYEAYTKFLSNTKSKLEKAEELLRNEKLQYQLKLKEWKSLSNQIKEKDTRFLKRITPVLEMDLSMIEDTFKV